MPASAVLRRPEGLGAAEAVALWGPFVTAYGALVDEGHVRPGDFVLITAASSSVGLATIDVANHIGAIPIAATRTAAKKQRLLDAGAAHVIVTDDEDIAERTLEITGNKGAQFVFDAVAGEGRDARRLRRARHQGNAVPAVVRADHAAVQRVRPDPGRRPPRPRGALRPRRCPSRDVRPRVDRTFDLTAIADAHRYLEANGQFGKVVVTVGG
ncbi:zinc-binding dehydrogenase [Amycolatopsis sp. NPDC021455]|uniref:zinc-binding dehydrogenase n=1 Tax=Amycolatopsis sp. NPDC021455 TaxID=3154901 RepID=UPI0033ECAEEB